MLQSIVYPLNVTLPLIRDANCIAIAVGLLSTVISLAILSAYFAGLVSWFLVVRSTDLFAVIFELYAVIRLSTFWPSRFLRAAGIVCRRAEKVMQAGAVDTVCFDKTGTLTEPEMRFVGVADASGEFHSVETIGDNRELMRLMATCHSLQRTEAGISGDAMDAELFKASFSMKNRAAFHLADQPVLQLRRLFFFCPHLRRQSVVLVDGWTACKGVPQSIREILSELPVGYDEVHARFTRQGFRLLAAAFRQLADLSSDDGALLTREAVEKDMCFIGFLLFENAVKPNVRQIIDTLHRSSIETVMLTGDDPRTAVAVARQVDILDSSAVFISKASGPYVCWQSFCDGAITISNPPKNAQLCITGDSLHACHTMPAAKVYACMSASQKASAVTSLRAREGRRIAFCGDGANDCAAMRASDAGIAVSMADSAALAATFICSSAGSSAALNPAEDSTLLILREGRAALVTTTSLVRLFALSSFIQITAMSSTFFTTKGAAFTNAQIILIDAICLSTLEFMLSRTKSAAELACKPPCPRLLTRTNGTCLLGFMAATIASHLALCTFISAANSASATFLLALLQVLIIGLLCALPGPHRRRISLLSMLSLAGLFAFALNGLYRVTKDRLDIYGWLNLVELERSEQLTVLLSSVFFGIFACLLFRVADARPSIGKPTPIDAPL